MTSLKLFVLGGFCLLFTHLSLGQNSKLDSRPMTNERMGKIVAKEGTILEGRPGFWVVKYHHRALIIITDELHNRMRIMTPIIAVGDIKKSKEVTKTLLEANFDRALDAKYAIDDGTLYSVFTHPLRELQTDQFVDALKQVKALADNYGGSYTSSDLTFGGKKED